MLQAWQVHCEEVGEEVTSQGPHWGGAVVLSLLVHRHCIAMQQAVACQCTHHTDRAPRHCSPRKVHNNPNRSTKSVETIGRGGGRMSGVGREVKCGATQRIGEGVLHSSSKAGLWLGVCCAVSCCGCNSSAV